MEVTRGFAQQIADRHGCAIDFAIHAPHRDGDERNHHAHLLATTRTIEATGLGEKTEIEWSDGNRRKAGLAAGKEEISEIREAWADFANAKLKELSLDARIDHRTLEAQGIDREPTVHLGPAVSAMERRGVKTEVGKRLEVETLEAAQQRIEKAAELGKLEREGQEIGRSILDLSGNIEDAKRIRDLELAKGGELGMGFGRRKPALEEQQAEARERWLEYRAKEQARQLERAQTPENSKQEILERVKSRARTPEEQQQEAIERLREYREKRDKGLDKSPDKGAEQALERTRGKDKGLDGPEFE